MASSAQNHSIVTQFSVRSVIEHEGRIYGTVYYPKYRNYAYDLLIFEDGDWKKFETPEPPADVYRVFSAGGHLFVTGDGHDGYRPKHEVLYMLSAGQWKTLGTFWCMCLDSVFITDIESYQGQIVVVGEFSNVDSLFKQNIVMYWNEEWVPFPGKIDGQVIFEIVEHTIKSMDVRGDSLVIGGEFTWVDGIEVNGIALFDHLGWHSLADGFDTPVTVYQALFRGSGEILSYGNQAGFDVDERFTLNSWSGTEWNTLNRDLAWHHEGLPGIIESSDGYIYAFNWPEHENENDFRVMRYDGFRWMQIGEGFNGQMPSFVERESGKLLIAGGFQIGTNKGFNTLAEWDGMQWIGLDPVITGIFETEPDHTSVDYSLHVYPNPVSDTGTLRFTLPTPTGVLIELYNMVGKRIRAVETGFKTAGEHQGQVDANGLAPGVYFLRLSAEEFSQTRKVVVVH